MKRLCLLLVIFFSLQAHAQLSFLQGPGKVTQSVFQELYRSMDVILENYIWEYRDSVFRFEVPALLPAEIALKVSCWNFDDRTAADFDVEYGTELVAGVRVDRLKFLCQDEFWLLKFERPEGSFKLEPAELLRLAWTERLKDLAEFRLVVDRMDGSRVILQRQKQAGQDVFQLDGDRFGEDFQYRITNKRYFVLRYQNQEVVSFEAYEEATGGSFPRIVLHNYLGSNYSDRAIFRSHYQAWFSGLYPFFVSGTLF